MDDRLRMQAGRARAEKIDNLFAKPRAAPGRRHDEGAGQPEPLRLLPDPRQRAGREDNTLRRDVVGEGGECIAVIRDSRAQPAGPE